MTVDEDRLSPEVLEAVLMKLGFSDRPPASLSGLRAVYGAWCTRVPFDNVQKLIRLGANEPGPLPGDSAAEFFKTWLAHGTGGTCWAGNGALHCLLLSLGFASTRGLGTMLLAPDIPPNHGTVLVSMDGKRYVVDASILHGEPLEIDETRRTGASGLAWSVSCERQGGHWYIGWRPVNMPEGLRARIEQLSTTRETFRKLHEQTRAWSPFNYELYARSNREDRVIGIAFGQRVELRAGGAFARTPLGKDERTRFLIEELGIDEETAVQVPEDRHRPPPPGSRTAAGLGSEPGL
jgi:N-hydroxyarylamine O-acetyltransferase